MEHIKQNDEGLYSDIQKIGCFFRSALLLAEIQTGKNLDVDTINKLWRRCKSLGLINGDNDVVRSAGIATLALRELGDQGFIHEIAVFKNGVTTWYSGVNHRIDYFIQKIKQNGPSKTHFRVVDKYGTLVEDPHRPAILCQGIIYSICYQYEAA